jgi:filamentous hemagglutinin family protein
VPDKTKFFGYSIFFEFFFNWFILANSTIAQIIPDNTLPVNSTVTSQPNITTIGGGTVTGGNLFHSFQEFSVPNGTVSFNNSINIQNIFTRVTGQSASNINALLRANGGANLFFINPNGITFGRNAALDIGGSFFASTANNILFSDGNQFGTINPQQQATLSINVPLGLQFPGFPTSIVNNSANLQVSPGKTIGLIGGGITFNNSNLNAPQGRVELGSVGENVQVNNRVTLNQTTNGFALGYANVNSFNDIQLLSQSSVSAPGGGEVFVRARDLTVANGSEISVVNLGSENAGKINIEANTVGINGISLLNNSPNSSTKVSTIKATSDGSGDSGSINITTNRLTVADGGDVSVTTFNSGNGGSLTVNALESIELTGAYINPNNPNNSNNDNGFNDFSRSGLFASTEKTGSGGNIKINTPLLRIKDGARVSVSTRGKGETGQLGGQGGTLNVNAARIEISGVSSGVSRGERFPSGLFALSGEVRPDPNIKPNEATGNGGNLQIRTGELIIRDGGQVSASTFGSGKAGNITVDANSIEIAGLSNVGRTFSTLAATSRGTGDSGNITINTRQLRTINGADVSVTAFQSSNGLAGRSGELTVNASDFIELAGANINPNNPQDFSRSGLFAATEGIQDGRTLTVNTPRLIVKDGARISTSTRGKGQGNIVGGTAGNLTINALGGIVELSGTSADGSSPSGLFALSGEKRGDVIKQTDATGDGGNLEIKTGQLIVQDGGQVSASTFGSGKAGNITVDANSIEIAGLSNVGRTFSTLAATSRGTGDSGNITINTRQLRTINGADVSVTAFQSSNGLAGRSGELTVNALDFIELAGANINPNNPQDFSRSGLFAATEGIQDGRTLTVNTPRLIVKDGARISTSTRGPDRGANQRGGTGGNLIINAVGGIVELSGTSADGRFPSGLFALSGEPRGDLKPEQATGIGGNLEVKTGLLNIRNRAEVSVSASGQAAAGTLQIQSNSAKLQDGFIRGLTQVGQGANTTLKIRDSLLLKGASRIETIARGENSDGGGIDIKTGAIAILENSSIKADAGRQGGNVTITTKGLFAFPNAITSSSDRGNEFNGIIQIINLDIAGSQGFVDIPTNFLSTENQVAQACSSEAGQNRNEFLITGRGGLPPSPTEPLSSEVVRVNSTNQTTTNESRLTNISGDNISGNHELKLPPPATSLRRKTNGEFVLATDARGQSSWLPNANCHSLR